MIPGDSSPSQPRPRVCLIIGAGAGIGSHTGRRFANAGYHVVFVRRTNQADLDALVASVRAAGGAASGRLLNIADDGIVEALIAQVETDVGEIEVCVFNIGAQIGDRSLEQTSLKVFELGWRLACFGLFRIARALLPYMQRRGRGALLVTSATAAVRGNAGQVSHSAAMAGRRAVCQSLNAEFASSGVHVAHVLVDGPVDAPDTLGKMLGAERFEQLRQSQLERLVSPAAVADAFFFLAMQPRSGFTFELDLRSCTETAWWNSRSTSGRAQL
jgi:NAD(P)-dependent dehydrogenase (short-subunit alcohol dehydrogenase family)